MSKTTLMRWPWRSMHQRLRWPDITQKIPVIVRILQAQTVFGVHRSTLYRWAKSQHITIHRRGAMSFVDPSEVYNFIMNGEGTQWGPARKRTKFMNDINESGAVGGTRTPTNVTSQRPQRCASTNSATTAGLKALEALSEALPPPQAQNLQNWTIAGARLPAQCGGPLRQRAAPCPCSCDQGHSGDPITIRPRLSLPPKTASLVRRCGEKLANPAGIRPNKYSRHLIALWARTRPARTCRIPCYNTSTPETRTRAVGQTAPTPQTS
jgi:hypothetical protein